MKPWAVVWFGLMGAVMLSLLGLLASIYLNTASGPAIVLVSIWIFFMTMLKRK